MNIDGSVHTMVTKMSLLSCVDKDQANFRLVVGEDGMKEIQYFSR